METAFSHWLKQRRKQLDLTAYQLAMLANCSEVAIRKFESGERRPSVDIARSLAQSLNVPEASRDSFVAFARGTGGAESIEQFARRAPNNLPIAHTSLVGRADALKALSRWLARDDIRLLTLLGAGGIGKTRLALSAAFNALDTFPDGAFFISLAAITDPELVVPAVARTLGVKEPRGDAVTVLDALKDHLRNKRMLLLLDNLEQVASCAPALAELLAASPALKVLGTSRTPLRLKQEHRYELLPLTEPDAAKLFIERAQTAKPAFTATPDDIASIKDICRRLDGLPLAIELVAARMRLMSAQQLLRRFVSEQGRVHIPIIADGLTDLPARHHTLHNTIAWSYNLLTDAQQWTFRQLGIFVGGFTLEAAESVLGAGPSHSPTPKTAEVWNAITVLLDNSLLQQSEQGGESRFALLETIREFALTELHTRGEFEHAAARHMNTMLELVERVEPHMTGSNQAPWLKRLDYESDNIRAAVRWGLAQDRLNEAAQVVSAIWRYWWIRGRMREPRQWADEMLAHADQIEPATRAHLMRSAGSLANQSGDPKRSYALNEMALTIERSREDKRGIALCLSNLARAADGLGIYDKAQQQLNECLTLMRDVGSEPEIARTLDGLAELAHSQGDYALAKDWYAQSLPIHERLNDKQSQGIALNNLGHMATAANDLETAEACGRQGLAIFTELGNKFGMCATHGVLATVAMKRGDYGSAHGHLAQSVALLRASDQTIHLIAVLHSQIMLLVAMKDWLSVARMGGALRALNAKLKRLLIPDDERDFERVCGQARAALGDVAFDAAWTAGDALTLDQALNDALEATSRSRAHHSTA